MSARKRRYRSTGPPRYLYILALFLVAAVCVAIAYGCGGSTKKKAATSAPEPAGLGKAFASIKAAADGNASVTACGDVNFGDGVTPSISAGGPDYPWSDASQVFAMSDLAFANLECCLSDRGSPVAGKEFTFRGPPECAGGMADAGIDVVSFANNHSKDWGTQAFLDTFTYLAQSGIKWCGAGNNSAEAFSPAVLETHGRKVAFLAYTWVVPDGWPAGSSSPGVATTNNPERVAESIRTAKSQADYVVASFHWGIELATSPNEEQRDLARMAVDNGADFVIGHHPHIVQGFEVYKNRLIAYSLGNFVFDPPREISAKTLTVTALLSPAGLIQARIVPMVISNCRPVILNGSSADSWLGTVAGYSRGLGTTIYVKNSRGFIDGQAPAAPAKSAPGK